MKKTLIKLGIHKTWFECLEPLFLNSKMKELRKFLNKSLFTPSNKDIFKVFRMPLDNIKVVIIGDSPVHKKGYSTGLAYASNKGFTPQLDFLLNTIESQLYKGHFDTERLDSIQLDLEYLEKQGVFLFNKSLTCQIGKRNSHEKQWKWFTDVIIDYLLQHTNGLIWMFSDLESKHHYFTNNFKECNNILHRNYGETIQWHETTEQQDTLGKESV